MPYAKIGLFMNAKCAQIYFVYFHYLLQGFSGMLLRDLNRFDKLTNQILHNTVVSCRSMSCIMHTVA